MANARFTAIFDWDGVIIDSSAYHRRSWDLLSLETGRALPVGHFEKGFGKKNEIIIPDILEWTKDAQEIQTIANRKEELYRQLLGEEGIAPMQGVEALLGALCNAGIPCGVGSSTPRANIDLVMELAELGEYFQTIVSAEDVHHGKPDPDVFLQVATRLRAEPAKCVVFEDAFVGIEAAHRAGMRVVGVATTNPLEKLEDADLAVQSLTEISLQTLENLF
ncbi:MAG: HAD family phosphatase [Chthoniobacterales bacterium]